MTSAPGVIVDVPLRDVLRRVVLIVAPALLLNVVVVFALYYLDLTNERTLYEQEGAHLVDLHAQIIAGELKSVESDLLYLANQALLKSYLADGAAPRELEDEYVLFCRRKAVYDQVRYLDNDGRERIRINDNGGRPTPVSEAELQTKASRYYFSQAIALPRDHVFVSPFDLNVEHDRVERPVKPVIRFATPVFDGEGQKRGLLVLNYLGAGLLRKLHEASTPFVSSAWVLNENGDFLRGPTRDDEWGFMLDHDRGFATSYPGEWARMAALGDGQFQTGRGLFTYRAVALSTEPGAGLVVVSYLPAKVLTTQANGLLGRLLLFSAIGVFLLVILAWYLARASVLRRCHEEQIVASEARLRTLSARLLTAQEDERKRLSRDLHDDLGQVVTALTIDLHRCAAASDPARKNDLLAHALQAADRLLEDLHEISTRVRPSLLDDLGLRDAVQAFLSDYERQTGVATRAELRFEGSKIPPAVSENAYRIIQEALTNVAKHAKAQEVHIALTATPGCLHLNVRDNGIGFTPGELEGKRLGLLGMRERTELLGGRFQVKSAPGQGTEVGVVLPLNPATGEGGP